MALAIDERADPVECPFCGGSTRNPRSLSISRVDTGLLYNCYRASCPAKGFISSNPSELVKHVSKKKSKTRPYSKATTLLPPYVYAWLAQSFGLSKQGIEREGWRWNDDEQRIVMPVRNQYHHTIGHNSRYWAELDVKGVGIKGGKAITYWDDPDVVKLQFPMNTTIGGNLVLVEDMPSAVRLAGDINCVALLGTHITPEAAALLSSMRYARVILALDADATAKALKIKQAYSFYFLRMDIVPLRGPDVKDMTIDQYNSFLQELNNE